MGKQLLSVFMFCLAVGLCGFSNGLAAQPFTIQADTSTAEGEAGNIIAPKTEVINQTQDTISFYWKRKGSQQPGKWQNPGVCDKNQCYNNKDSATFSLAPQKAGQLKINFYAYDTGFKSVEGKGNLTVEVGVIDEAYPNAKPQATYFEAKTKNFTSAQHAPEKTPKEVRTYPNPVQNKLNIDFGKQGTYHLQVFNVLGKPVIQKVLQGREGKINTRDLEKGVYVLQYQSANGRKGVKRFFKQ